MENVKSLLDACKAAKGVESDYALAMALNLPKQRISDYYKRTGSRVPDEYACLQIAKALNRPLADVLAVVRISEEKDEKRRAAWVEYYKSIGGIAAAWAFDLLVNVTLIMTPPAEASENQAFQTSTVSRIQIMRLMQRVRETLSSLARRLRIFAPRAYIAA